MIVISYISIVLLSLLLYQAEWQSGRVGDWESRRVGAYIREEGQVGIYAGAHAQSYMSRI